MISPRVVSNPATETIRWNEVIGRASQEPTWLNGANLGMANDRPVPATSVPATTSAASGVPVSPVSPVSAVSLESAPRRRSRDNSVATPTVPRRERRPRTHHRGRRSR